MATTTLSAWHGRSSHGPRITLANAQQTITNWSMTERSLCHVEQPYPGILRALGAARVQSLSAIVHAAGHSYTDAALNTNGLIVDVTAMRRILNWDPALGIMQVEPGVSLREVVQRSLPDGWWPAVSPSTADATVGGCVAMNVTGKNAMHYGSFGEQVVSLSLLLANGELLSVSAADPALFHAVVGSAGLLGVITSITLQLRRVRSPNVDVQLRPATSLGELFDLFAENQAADFLEGWVDGFATGAQLGRGFLTCSRHSADGAPVPSSGAAQQLQGALLGWVAGGARFALYPSVRLANDAAFRWSNSRVGQALQRQSLIESTYFAPAAYVAFRNLLPHGIETFHVFVPRNHAPGVFRELLRRSQAGTHLPIWCIVKQHRPDPFLLSYQVDGFSLELNYARDPRTLDGLRRLLRELMDDVIGAGGRFYLAKDSLLTAALYRRSLGADAVDAFLRLKQALDPGSLFQSNLFRRVFQSGESVGRP